MRSRVAMIVLGSFTMLIAACSSDTPSAPDVTSAAPDLGKATAGNRNTYDFVGKFHNDALANALVKIRASKKLTKLDRCRVGLAAIKDFARQYKKSDGSSFVVDPVVIDGMCDAAATTGFAESRASLFNPANISSSASGYMDDINTAVDYSASLPAYSFAVNRIQNEAEETLGAGSLETNAVFATGSVGVSSEEYWIANESSWSGGTPLQTAHLAPTGTGLQNQVSSRTKRIIRADVSAAIAVLVREWWMGDLAIEKAMFQAAAASMIAGISVLF